MSTAVAERPAAPAFSGGSSDLAGTGKLLRLYLRRDRVVLPLWSVLFGLLPLFYLTSTEAAYEGKPGEVQRYADSIDSSPALQAMYGPLFGHGMDTVALWKAGPFFAMIAIATILTVIRHTRVEEDTGRAEFLGATSVGRYAGLTAALLMTSAGCVVTGVLCALTLRSGDVSTAGSVAFAATLAGSGLAWAGFAALAVQLGSSARIARGIALGTLAGAFAVRAIGDAGNGVLSWLSPLGWCIQVRPIAEIRWWALLPVLAFGVVSVALGYALLRRRDLGSGLVAERPGPAAVAPALAGALGLAWRLQRGSLLAWAVGFLLYGLLMGGVVNGIGDMMDEGTNIADIVTKAGGSDILQDAFVTLGTTMLALAAAAYTISATLRLHDEESSQRAETLLAGSVGRVRYAVSHLGFALLGAAGLMLIAATSMGVVYGIMAGDVAGKLGDTLGAALVNVPAVWVVTGIAVAIYGLAPRFTPVVWGVLSAMLVLYFLGALDDSLPGWLVDLVPFTHSPKLPGGDFAAQPILWLLGIAAALLATGLIAFRRRDLR
ncbi:ABC transporter permease [Nocardia sp. NPDC050435]|uniref:ABC transporter permease n=1 Tax=Nocardia sp. NPDC050435 TaxID=3155040 RepID=UPI0033DBF7AC